METTSGGKTGETYEEISDRIKAEAK